MNHGSGSYVCQNHNEASPTAKEALGQLLHWITVFVSCRSLANDLLVNPFYALVTIIRDIIQILLSNMVM